MMGAETLEFDILNLLYSVSPSVLESRMLGAEQWSGVGFGAQQRLGSAPGHQMQACKKITQGRSSPNIMWVAQGSITCCVALATNPSWCAPVWPPGAGSSWAPSSKPQAHHHTLSVC